MPNRIPSVNQVIVSNETADHLAKLLEKETPIIAESKACGLAPGDSKWRMPELPASAVKAWAGACAETYRKLMLDYWRELGLFPD